MTMALWPTMALPTGAAPGAHYVTKSLCDYVTMVTMPLCDYGTMALWHAGGCTLMSQNGRWHYDDYVGPSVCPRVHVGPWALVPCLVTSLD